METGKKAFVKRIVIAQEDFKSLLLLVTASSPSSNLSRALRAVVQCYESRENIRRKDMWRPARSTVTVGKSGLGGLADLLLAEQHFFSQQVTSRYHICRVGESLYPAVVESRVCVST